MTKDNSTIIATIIAVIIVASAGFFIYANDVVAIEAGQFAATLFATIAGLLAIASFTELNRQTLAIAKNQ